MVKKKFLIFLLVWLVFFSLCYIMFRVESINPNGNIKSYFDSIWYGLVTITTVGYGDFYPTSLVGRLIGMLFVVSSIGVVGYLIGTVFNYFRLHMEHYREGIFGTSFKDHILFIGWNEFSRDVFIQVLHSGRSIAIVTDNKEHLESIKQNYPQKNIFVMYSEYGNFELYNKVNIQKCNTVFVNLGEDTRTLVFIINLSKYYKKLRYVVAIDNPELKETYESLGVKFVFSKRVIASKIVGSFLFEPDVATYTNDLITTSMEDDDSDIFQFKVVSKSMFHNMDYTDAFITLKRRYNIILIGLSRKENNKMEVYKNPSSPMEIEIDDYLLAIGDGVSKKRLFKEIKQKEGI